MWDRSTCTRARRAQHSMECGGLWIVRTYTSVLVSRDRRGIIANCFNKKMGNAPLRGCLSTRFSRHVCPVSRRRCSGTNSVTSYLTRLLKLACEAGTVLEAGYSTRLASPTYAPLTDPRCAVRPLSCVGPTRCSSNRRPSLAVGTRAPVAVAAIAAGLLLRPHAPDPVTNPLEPVWEHGDGVGHGWRAHCHV